MEGDGGSSGAPPAGRKGSSAKRASADEPRTRAGKAPRVDATGEASGAPAEAEAPPRRATAAGTVDSRLVGEDSAGAAEACAQSGGNAVEEEEIQQPAPRETVATTLPVCEAAVLPSCE